MAFTREHHVLWDNYDNPTIIFINEKQSKHQLEKGWYKFQAQTDQEPYFVLKAVNGEIIGVSETFSSETAMENAISSVMRNAPVAEISTTAS